MTKEQAETLNPYTDTKTWQTVARNFFFEQLSVAEISNVTTLWNIIGYAGSKKLDDERQTVGRLLGTIHRLGLVPAEDKLLEMLRTK